MPSITLNMTTLDGKVPVSVILVILSGFVVFFVAVTTAALSCEQAEFSINELPPYQHIRLSVLCRTSMNDNPTVSVNNVVKDFSLTYLSARDEELFFNLIYNSSFPETNVARTLMVTVKLGDEMTTVPIKIYVKDMNNKPELSSLDIMLKEGELGNWTIPVRDQDSTQRNSSNETWGDLTFTSIDMPPEFAIVQTNRTHFLLRLLRPLDAEDERWINFFRPVDPNPGVAHLVKFTLTATDGGGLNANGLVTVRLEGVNDNMPQCDPIPPILAPRNKSQIYIYRPIFNPNEYCRDDDFCQSCKLDFKFLGDQECKDTFEISRNAILTTLTAGNQYPPTGRHKCNVSIVFMDNDFEVPVSFEVVFPECPAGVDPIFNITWEEGWPGTYTRIQCPPGYTGTQARLCDIDGVYQVPFINCTSSMFRELEEQAKNSNNISVVLEHLANLTSSTTTGNTTGRTITAGDVTAAANILAITSETVRKAASVDNGVVQSFLGVADNLMGESSNLTWQSMLKNNGPSVDRVLNTIDDFMETVTGTFNATSFKQTHVKSNLYVAYGRDSHCQQGLDFPNRTSTDVPIWAMDTPDRIFIPCGKDVEGVSYSSVMYKDLRGIIPNRVESDSLNETLNSAVMSMSLYPRKNTTLEKPVTITFKLLTKKETFEPRCSYWKDGPGAGYWSSQGCVRISFDAGLGTVVCQCDHLTNFAILMSPVTAVPTVHTQVLSIISLVGCIVSMTFLAITIGVHLYFWKKVSGERTILLLNMCITLFLAYLLFLAGVDKVDNKGICTVVAVLLHFIYLVVFFTMLAKGALLAKTVLKPFNKSPLAKWGISASYGGAAIVVGVAMGVTRLDGYGSSTTCWLSVNKGLIWAFVGPVLFVIMVNVSVLVIVMYQMYGTTAMLSKTAREKAKVGVRSMGVLLPVLGVTWVFGVFSVNEDTVMFQYLFAICNSLQGLLIFVFQCVLNKKVKDAVVSSWKAVPSSDSFSSDKKTHTTGVDLETVDKNTEC